MRHDLPEGVGENHVRVRRDSLPLEGCVQRLEPDVRADHAVAVVAACSQGRTDLPAGVESIGSCLDLHRGQPGGLEPRTIAWIVLRGIIGSHVLAQDIQGRIEMDMATDRRIGAALDALDHVHASCRRAQPRAFDLVAQSPDEEEVAGVVADVYRRQGRGAVQGLAHQVEPLEPIRERNRLLDRVVAEQIHRHFRRRDEIPEFRQRLVADPLCRILGGRLEHVARQLEPDAADQDAHRNDEQKEQGRDVDMQRQLTCHFMARSGGGVLRRRSLPASAGLPEA
jgi:hypothetical protein